MSSIGYGLLKSIVVDSVPLSEVAALGVKSDKFVGQEKDAFEFIQTHFITYGRYPELRTVEAELDIQVFDTLPVEPAQYWATQVQDRWLTLKLQQIRDQIGDQLAGDNGLQTALTSLNNAQEEIAQDRSFLHVQDMHNVQHQVLEQHRMVQQMSVIPGVPFGFPFLDEVSGGAQAGDIIVLVGESGVGKTWMSLKLARAAREANYNVLAVCTEMPEQQVARRDLAMKGGINSSDLKLGRTSEFAVDRLNGLLDISENRTANEDSFYKILPGGIYGTYETIATVAKETKPHLLVVDGAALIRTENFKGSRWERIIEIIEAFKQLAMHEDHLRIILTFHYGKSGPGKQENIYGGMAISQFASIILSFEFERQEDRNNPSPVQYRNLKMIKGRDGETGTLRILYDMRKSSITEDQVIAGNNYVEEMQPEVERDDYNHEDRPSQAQVVDI